MLQCQAILELLVHSDQLQHLVHERATALRWWKALTDLGLDNLYGITRLDLDLDLNLLPFLIQERSFDAEARPTHGHG